MTFRTRLKKIVYYSMIALGYALVGVVILGAIATVILLGVAVFHEPLKILSGLGTALMICAAIIICILLFEWSKS